MDNTRYGMGTARTQEISRTAEKEVTRRPKPMDRSNVDASRRGINGRTVERGSSDGRGQHPDDDDCNDDCDDDYIKNI